MISVMDLATIIALLSIFALLLIILYQIFAEE